MLLLYSGSQFIILPQGGRGDIGGVGGIGHIGVGSVGDEGDRGNVVDRGRGGVGSIIYSLDENFSGNLSLPEKSLKTVYVSNLSES